MKRFLALLLVAFMLMPALAETGNAMKLTTEITGTQLLESWDGQTSDEYSWFVVDMQLTNWHTDTQNIAGNISGRLLFHDVYSFDAIPSFDSDTIAPLVEKNGSLVFEIPKMVARAMNPDEVKVYITVEGTEQEVGLDEKAAYIRTGHIGSFEGPGYDTPEDAVLAYIDAMNRGSVTDMLSTFAIESYAEHADQVSNFRRFKSFSMSTVNAMPTYSPYSRELMLYMRYGELVRQLYNHYVEATVQTEGATIMTPDAASYQELLDKFSNSPVDHWFGNIEFVEWLEPAGITPKLLLAPIVCNTAYRTMSAGAEDSAVLTAHIRLNGTDAIQSMGCLKYGNRWYNSELNNSLSSILDLNNYAAGLIFPSGVSDWDMSELLKATPNGETQIMLTAWNYSGLTGTKWLLTAINQPGILVTDTPDGIREKDIACLYASLHFMSRGGATADIQFSPILDSVIADGYPSIKAAMAWTNVDGNLKCVHGYALYTSGMELDGITGIRSGDTLVLRWPEGMEASFQLVED